MSGSFFLFNSIKYLLYLSVLVSAANCGAISKENPCDSSSDAFLKNQLLKFLLNDTSSSCAVSVSECGALKMGESAKVVLGQPDFVSNTSGSAINQVAAGGLSMDSQGGLWASDTNNQRVFHFSSPFSTFQDADIILTGFDTPRGVAVDPNGGLWVASTMQDLVYHFPSGVISGGVADITLGTFNSNNQTQNTFNNPWDLAADSSGSVWVADYFNSRVLRFSPPFTSGMNADLVLGKSSFTSGAAGASANQMASPNDVEVDSSGKVWVADTGNHRVLRFSPPFSNGMAADLVLGQPDFVSSSYALDADSLSSPNGVSIASNGAVWVADSGNMRAVRFSPPFTNGKAADNVLGEPDLVSTNSSFIVSDKTIGSTSSVAVAPCGLWISDTTNNRVLFFP
ncbi:NHL repeat-containing protein [Leptospira wolffii]|uniref:NHL repeat-containing protein n=1 Tax=Leptospira wolffii TaxID=409998 RepID=UPI001AF008EF|nr:NHL repeat-containing protein [Leptospira wolffii]